MADTSVARDQLRSIVERIERLEEEKKAINRADDGVANDDEEAKKNLKEEKKKEKEKEKEKERIRIRNKKENKKENNQPLRRKRRRKRQRG